MGWTKKQLITEAYNSIGLADYVFDISPEDLQSACRKMDSMIASWEGKGVHIGYSSSDTPQSADTNADSGVPSFATSAVYLNLAMVLAPAFRIPIPVTLYGMARSAYLDCISAAMEPPKQCQMPSTLPRGAGQKNPEYPYMSPPTEYITTTPGGDTLDD